jgi:hypothetical protein
MKATRIAAVTALVALGLSVGACGSKDVTGPTISLSLEEVYALANELGSTMSSLSLSLRARLGPAFSIVPGSSMSPTSPINATVSCPDGGNASAAGSYGGTTAVTADVTLTYTGCKTAHYLTNGSIRVTGSGTSTPTDASGQATVSGALTVTTSDGRAGSCEIDFTVTGSASGADTPAFTMSGRACGANVSGAY